MVAGCVFVCVCCTEIGNNMKFTSYTKYIYSIAAYALPSSAIYLLALFYAYKWALNRFPMPSKRAFDVKRVIC